MPDSSPKWTDEQRDAIHTIDKSVIVSAAAGSGKTAVLAQRCVHVIVDPESACDVDRLLVVTFTKDAAAEMRSRIEQRLRARFELEPDNTRLEKQLYLLQRAQISTIHSFCARIIQQHFHHLGLDPSTQQLQEEEAALMRTQLARDLIHERYARPHPEDFEHLLEWYFDSNDERLVGVILHVYHLLTSVVDPRQWARDSRKRTQDAIDDLPTSEFGRQLFNLVKTKLSTIIAQADAYIELYKCERDLSGYITAASDVRVEAQMRLRLAEDGDLAGLARATTGYDAGTARASQKADKALRETAKKALDRFRNELKNGEVAALCRFSISDWSDGLATTQSSVIQLLALTRQFMRRYQKAKRAIRSMDYADLERYALTILTRHPEVAAQYQQQYCHVLVDEFQDINDVQKHILMLVSRENSADENVPANLFTVGDVKQSIYRFRLADPTLFLDRYDQFATKPGPRRKAIDLQKNFRSRAPLLDAINFVFERLMTKSTADIDYDQTHKLIPGTTYPKSPANFNGTPVEIHLLEKTPRGKADDDDAADTDELDDLDRTEREAMLIAHRINEVMNQSPAMEVCDKTPSGLVSRKLSYKDIVILLRAKQVKAQQFSEQLQQAGIPVHAETGSGFFESLEIRDSLALLQLLENQQQDIALAAVLRSPFCNLTNATDSLAQIRLTFPADTGLPFHQAVLHYCHSAFARTAPCAKDDRAKIVAFLSQLERWRNLAHRKPLAEVLATIYADSGYLNWTSGLPNGRQRVANLLNLLERAKQFGSFQRQGLGRFLDFLQKLEEQSDLGQPSMLGEGEDAVRIMTIHASKGLEYPVVFVADLGKQHNRMDERSTILTDRDLGVAMNAVDPLKRIRYQSVASMIVKQKMHAAGTAEELRVLYVAMTRAREHLILVGTCTSDEVESWKTTWTHWRGAIPTDDVLSAKSFLGWIMPAAFATNSQTPGTFELHQHTLAELEALASARVARAVDAVDPTLALLQPLAKAPAMADSTRAVLSAIAATYPLVEFTKTNASQSVTAATKQKHDEPPDTVRMRAMYRPVSPLVAPRFLSGDNPVSAIDAGTATHLVLEHLDFSNAASIATVENQINDLVARRQILPVHAAAVDRDAIMWLMQTEVGAYLTQYNSVLKREWPINFSNQVAGRSGLDLVMVRGRLDLLIPAKEGLILLDYKTDNVNAITIEERVTLYQPQLAAYAQAIEQISGQKVVASYLVFLKAKMIRKV